MQAAIGPSKFETGEFFMHGFIRSVSLLSLLLFASGCIALALGAAGGAAGVTYAKGKLTVKLDASVAQVHAATIMALEEQALPIHVDEHYRALAKLKSESADGKNIWINIDFVTATTSKITIRVGATGDHPRSLRLLDAIKANL